MLNVNYNGQQTASVEITGSFFSADYNQNGTVDAADYVLWRKNDSSQAGYDQWGAHFGQTTLSGWESVRMPLSPSLTR